jgi:diguanylate cyclase (GGDEF)-like protein
MEMVIHSMSLVAQPGDGVATGVHPDRAAVCVFDAPESLDALTETLLRIGYRALSVSFPEDGSVAPTQESFSVVIITDGAGSPLERAAEMSTICPVLFITSDVTVEARVAAARAGVDAILARPLDVSELAEWLNDLVGTHRDSPLSVLIVDDDQILAEAYALTLKNAGIHTIVETNPLAVFGRLTASAPDLILMDMQMPNTSGMELAKIIRQSRRHLSLPIVFLSGERELGRQLEARRLGGDDFISKPVDPAHLVSLVRMRADRGIRLRSIMERDSLTGLLNHARFTDRLDHELERCRRSGGEVSLALIDIDLFKDVNDRFGHVIGDRVLRNLAHTLTVGFRRIDIVGRFGGEEFGVLLLDTPPEAAWIVVDRVRQRFSEIQFATGKQPFSVTFSAGVSGSRTHFNSEEIVAAADASMYRAKAAGRNRVLGSIEARV